MKPTGLEPIFALEKPGIGIDRNRCLGRVRWLSRLWNDKAGQVPLRFTDRYEISDEPLRQVGETKGDVAQWNLIGQ